MDSSGPRGGQGLLPRHPAGPGGTGRLCPVPPSGDSFTSARGGAAGAGCPAGSPRCVRGTPGGGGGGFGSPGGTDFFLTGGGQPSFEGRGNGLKRFMDDKEPLTNEKTWLAKRNAELHRHSSPRVKAPSRCEHRQSPSVVPKPLNCVGLSW